VRWNPGAEAPPLETLGELDIICHLAGEPVAEGRWAMDR
jgi:NAD dependent epimerase/dehydratase family enzyme